MAKAKGDGCLPTLAAWALGFFGIALLSETFDHPDKAHFTLRIIVGLVLLGMAVVIALLLWYFGEE